MNGVERARGVLLVALVIFLGGVGLSFGAFASYHDQHSGMPGKAKIGECSGHDGRYDTGVHCNGTWEVGGSVANGGKVANGYVEGADRGDTGKTLDVRIHGADHATVPRDGTPITLAALGVPMLLFGLYLLSVWWRGGGVAKPRAPQPAAEPSP